MAIGLLLLAAPAAGSYDRPEVLSSFTPAGLLPGDWIVTVGPQEFAVPEESIKCSGERRRWSRADGMTIGFVWLSCAGNDLERLARAEEFTRSNAPQEQRTRSVLDHGADFVRPLGDGVVRSWIEAGYQLAVAASPCEERTVDECYKLTGAATRAISAALPGEPTTNTLLPESVRIVSAVFVYWILFVGLPMLGRWLARPVFDPGPQSDPRLTNVDSGARRLRWRARGRRTGHFLATLALLHGVTVTASAIRAGYPSAVGIATDVVMLGGGLVMARLCRHPQLSAPWLRYWPRPRRLNLNRLASSGLTLFLGLFAAAFPLAALFAIVLLSLASADDKGYRVVAGVSFAATGLGYLIDRLARRLRARTAQELTDDRHEPPLLYLRNFGDDAVKVPTSPLSRVGLFQLLTSWANPFRSVRFEELLCRLLGRWGPVTGFNDPNLRLATLGAGKTLAPNDGWQQALTARAENSYAVVISATPSDMRPGLRWELDMLANSLSHGRVILVLGTHESVKAVTGRFQAFLSAVRRYEIFAPLARGWIPSGALVLVHVPAEGKGTWMAWTARRRTAWTYATAIDAAFTFAKRAWAEDPETTGPAPRPQLLPAERTSVELSNKVVAALDYAASVAPPGHPVDTRLVLAGLMRADSHGDWSRIWLHGRSLDSVDRTFVADPEPAFIAYWRGKPMTETCDIAVRTAHLLSDNHRISSVPVGMMVVALIANLRSAAAVSIGITSLRQQRRLTQLVEQDLLGFELNGPATAGPQAPQPPPLRAAGPPPRKENEGRFGTFLIAVLIVTLFSVGSIGSLAENAEQETAWIVIGNLLWVPLLLFFDVLLRKERKYRWHIIVGGTLANLAVIAAGIIALN